MNTSRLKVFSPVALLSLLLVGGGCGEVDRDEHDATSEQTMTSDAGHFTGYFVPDPDPPVAGDNLVTIHLTGTDDGGCCDGEPVVGADIEVEPWMPGHGHGSPEKPEVFEEADGQYVVSNIVYNMPGHWELRVDVMDGDIADHFVVDYEVQ